MLKSILKPAALACALFTSASAVSATTVSLTYHGASAGADAKNVTISAAPVEYPGAGDWPKQVGAFGFNMTDTTATLGSFVAWCLDLGSFLSTSSTAAQQYTITKTPFSNSYGMTASQIERVQALFDLNYSTLDTSVGNQAAGFQLALWNALYDTDWTIAGGTFYATASTTIITLANGYLSAASSADVVKGWNLTFLESSGTDKRQNLVTATPVPLPAAMGLMLLALGGLGAVARRRRSA